jgi:predicted 3-demethylubiquinone-9 3-methyltransferase (glyoxalase superfamily)
MQKITPFLWFDDKAEEAMNFYTSIFKNSKIIGVSRYGDGAPRPKGMVMTATFEIEGMQFTALNGGPEFAFTPAVSFYVACNSQEEVDYFWNKLTEGGKPSQCGWLEDKFGVSWQIVPTVMIELLQDKNAAKAQKVLEAMLKMSKIEVPKLMEAYAQG